MTRKVGNVLIIEQTPDEKCEECGKMDELRPYGPGGMKICFDCAMKDEAGTNARMNQFFETGQPETRVVH